MYIVLISLLMVFSFILAERIILLDLSPEDAQKYISRKTLDLSYAKVIGKSPLTQYVSKQEFYHKGHLIDSPTDFMHTQYEANQFQAQDGLGRSMFGYADWNQGRLEARNANGDIRGSYQYVDPKGQNIVVNYWSDILGYHQMDNRPKTLLQSVTETAEVHDARLAHAQAWKAAAKAALENPDPMSDIYNENANRLEIAQSIIEKAVNVPSSGVDEPIRKIREDEKNIHAEPSIPRGFYYHIDYPVHVVSFIESSKKSKRSDDFISEIPKKDQIALEAVQPKISIVTAEQSHPIANEKVVFIDAVKARIDEPFVTSNITKDDRAMIKGDEQMEKTEKLLTLKNVMSNDKQLEKLFKPKQPEIDLIPPELTSISEKSISQPEVMEKLLKPKESLNLEELDQSVEFQKLEKPTKLNESLKSEEATANEFTKSEKSGKVDKSITSQESIKDKSKESAESKKPTEIQKQLKIDKSKEISEPSNESISEQIFQIDPKISDEPLTSEEIPVEIKFEKQIPNIQQQSPEDAEIELRKLATNEDVIDAIHDVQIHPKQIIDM